MFALITRAALVLVLFIGTVGGISVLADESLPGTPMYPFKLMFEQWRLTLNNDPAAEAQLYLAMAQTRVREIEQMAHKGSEPPIELMAQLQTQLAQAYHHAAQAPNDAMTGVLAQARVMTETSERTLQQAQIQVHGLPQKALRTAEMVLNRARQTAQFGLDDPAGFRNQYAAGPPDTTPFDPASPDDADCQVDCEPAGDEQQYGPQPTPPAGPHNGDCNGDCEPVGDQHQRGPQQGATGGSHRDRGEGQP